jgi:tRNA threonylcarbamoyladenosine biosynthesis protein TsaE
MINEPALLPINGPILCIDLPDIDASNRFATLCAQHLAAGDTVLLSGAVGTGKSHFARALIRHHLGPDTDVPSPSFTLVQVYAAAFEIWHADLYRLTHTGELGELGLDEAMGRALCLIEWPDRLGDMPLGPVLRIDLSYHGDGRRAQVSGASPPLTAALRRAFAP